MMSVADETADVDESSGPAAIAAAEMRERDEVSFQAMRMLFTNSCSDSAVTGNHRRVSHPRKGFGGAEAAEHPGNASNCRCPAPCRGRGARRGRREAPSFLGYTARTQAWCVVGRHDYVCGSAAASSRRTALCLAYVSARVALPCVATTRAELRLDTTIGSILQTPARRSSACDGGD